MALAKTAPLRSALAQALPERPFSVAFWDGTEVPATAPGPRFTVRSPRAVAHALYAPGQLGLGRAYVSGELDVDRARVRRLAEESRERVFRRVLAAGPLLPPAQPEFDQALAAMAIANLARAREPTG